MKTIETSLIRPIASSGHKICTIIIIALAVILVAGTTVNAQLPTNYGKPLVVNGKLLYVPTASHTVGSSMTSSGITRYFHYEPIGNKLARVDFISKAPDKHLAMRFIGTEYGLCLIHKNPQDGTNKGNPQLRISGALKVSSTGPVPVKTVAEEEKKSDEKKTEEESKKPEQIFPITVLLQDRNGLIRLLIQTDETTLQEYQVKNFWELFILVPENSQKDFFELLKNYSPMVFTTEQNTRQRVYSAISKSVQLNDDNHQEYQKLIDDLSSDVYMKRVAAMNRIQNEGSAFLGFVQKLDMSKLEPEARVRLSNFLSNDSYVCDTDDIEDMSILFANSLYANIPLLESDNASFNAIAQERLRAKLGDSFKFDKSAPDDVRAAQIQELKNTLGFPKPRTIQMDEQMQKRFKDLVDSLFDQTMSSFKF